MTHAIESDEDDPVPVCAEVAFTMMDQQTAELVEEQPKVAMHVYQHKLHCCKINNDSVLRNQVTMQASTMAPLKPMKLDSLDDS
jgi:hypothetical protein